MKKKKIRWILILSTIIISCVLTIPIFGLTEHPFYFYFPDYFGGSLQYTDPYTRTSGTPYVETNYAIISTYFFLSPNVSYTYATDPKNVTYQDSYSLYWRSGYGGSGQSYRLCAYTNPANGTWTGYPASGKWAE